MSSTMSSLNVLVKNNICSQLLGRLCDGCGFPCARLQSFVLVPELLVKLAGLLFAVPVGWDESLNFHLQLLSVACF